jgi:branched-subunit amino acid aminotransferase/4-amino-4-deoxychorismate lyase
MKYTWISGKYIEDQQACIHVSDLAIQRGYGVFDFFRLREKTPFLLSHYLDRFWHSAKELHLKPPVSKKELSLIIHEFIEKNQLENHGIKMILTGGYAQDGYIPMEPNMIIRAYAITMPTPEKYQVGYRVMTNEYQRGTPESKSIDYRHGISLIPRLKERRLDDVLYVSGGIISEFPRSNFFMVDQQDRIVTPKRNILNGITRRVLLQIAREHYVVETRDVLVDELLIAKEAFLTSTTRLVMPVCEIDNHKIGNGIPGQVTKHLTQLMQDLPTDFELI